MGVAGGDVGGQEAEGGDDEHLFAVYGQVEGCGAVCVSRSPRSLPWFVVWDGVWLWVYGCGTQPRGEAGAG